MLSGTMAHSIMRLSVDGIINGIDFKGKTFGFAKYVEEKTSKDVTTLSLSIRLPDGVWDLYIRRYDKRHYDYHIPETREEQDKIRLARML